MESEELLLEHIIAFKQHIIAFKPLDFEEVKIKNPPPVLEHRERMKIYRPGGLVIPEQDYYTT